MRTRALTALAAGIIIPLAGLAMATAPARAATASLLPCALKTGDKLTYHQHGLVADDPAVVLILWGHYWTTDRAKPQISELE